MTRTAIAIAVLVLIAGTLPAKERRRRLPKGVRLDADLVYGRGGGRDLHLDLYRPEEAAGTLPLIVWIHGGGWRAGSKERTPAVRMVARGYAVAGVEYRLSGEAAFPAQIHDVKAAVRYLRANAEKLGIDPERFGAWGSSAGGHLAALLGTSGGVEELEGDGGNPGTSSRVQAVCDWFGPADLARMGDRGGGAVSLLLGGSPEEKAALAWLGSPVVHVTRDDPPFLIMHGDRDRVVPLSQSRLLDETLRRAGVPSTLHVEEGAGHGFRGEHIHRMVDDFFDRYLRPESLPLVLRVGPEEEFPGFEAEIHRAVRDGRLPRMVLVGLPPSLPEEPLSALLATEWRTRVLLGTGPGAAPALNLAREHPLSFAVVRVVVGEDQPDRAEVEEGLARAEEAGATVQLVVARRGGAVRDLLFLSRVLTVSSRR